MKNKVRFGLDIGIGSIGWCIISGEKEMAKIEDFGVRIFESGEIKNGKDRKSQQRRGFRSVRRLNRRRVFRKKRIKAHLQNIGFTTIEKIEAFFQHNSRDIYEIKAMAAKEQVTPEETAACLIHACNFRGYRDFYEEAEKEAAGSYDQISEEEGEEKNKEETVNQHALSAFDQLFRSSGCDTVSEFIVKEFKKENDNFPSVRNRETHELRYLIRREYVRDEISQILYTQSKYYSCLNKAQIDMALQIIFAQRDFEDGPGNPNEKYRRYTGFLDSRCIGKCMFYHDMDRGFRSTVIADLYAVTNTLSQYRYKEIQTGDSLLSKDAAGELVQFLLDNGNLTMTDVRKILKKHGIQLLKSENSDDKALSKAVKYLKTAKRCIEDAGLEWQDYISEPQLDYQHFSKLHKLGEVISKYHTPSRRRKELAKLDFATEKLAKAIAGKKISGTSNVSYKYMCEAVQAFLNGEIYGNFQAEKLKAQQNEKDVKDTRKMLLAVLEDDEVRKNPVVFRSINETRKIINELVRVYGSPDCINIEVASELNRSFTDRLEIKNKQLKNEKRTARIRAHIAGLLNIPEDEVRQVQIEKYRLYEEQGGKCLYSGNSLGDLQDVLEDRQKRFEIDHIIPYSLILDNSLNNKALVWANENQTKRQRTPLMYLSQDKRDAFLATINVMYTRKENQISKRKYQYLKLEKLYDKEAEEILRDWKSRNINDTRYITKYIIAYIKDNLIFSGRKTTPVYGIKGSLTSRFRRIWLNEKTWGGEEKNRDETHLHHAVDAVIIANLTPEYVEIASDNIKLQQIQRRYRSVAHPEYQEYLAACIRKMKNYYGFNEEYARVLLTKTQRVPSYVPNLRDEVDIRFNDQDEELWQIQVKDFYAHKGSFVRPPRIPLVSYKEERKFRGPIADSNPIKLCEIDGQTKKIKRFKVHDITIKHLDKLRTGDKSLETALRRILTGKDEKYTVGKFLKDSGLPFFQTDLGQRVNKVSLVEGTTSNFYRKDINAQNYSNMGGLNYYCVEIYQNTNGETCTWGIKYVDAVKRDKKLLIKPSSLPADYGQHVMYLFSNEFIEIINKKGETKFQGYYKAVFNINSNAFYYARGNQPKQPRKCFTIASNDKVKKYHVDILGRRGGEVKCSVPLSLLRENESEQNKTGW